MTKPLIACILALMVLSFGLGALLAGRPQAALADDKPAAGAPAATESGKPAEGQPATTVQALTKPADVVAAVPSLSRTDYEQDPFDPSRLRRTQTTVVKLILVRADGTTETKAAP
jgi:hypothetical protein